jgi:lipopolysaccharide transport system permease protein
MPTRSSAANPAQASQRETWARKAGTPLANQFIRRIPLMTTTIENPIAAPSNNGVFTKDVPAEVELRELVIRPRRGWIGIDWEEMWHFRELLYFMTWRDVKVRYKQSALGVAWAVIVPVFSMVIFTVIFGNFADMKKQLPEGLNYAVFVYGGLLPWTFFASAISLGGLSLVNQQTLLTKIYFPRLFVPASAVGGALVDMAISFGVMFALMGWYHVVPTWTIFGLVPMMILLILASLGVAFYLSAITVTYRDFRFILQFLVQAWMYLSPVIYPVHLVPPRFQWVLALNPMYGIIEGFRWSLLGKFQTLNYQNLAISSASSIIIFVFGLFYFRKTERRFADIA